MSTSTLDPFRREYRQALRTLASVHVPFVIGGAWAVEHYARLGRATLDLDLMIAPMDVDRAQTALLSSGARILEEDEAQVRIALADGEIDLVHHIAQGEYEVGPDWRQHAVPTRLLGLASLVAAPEELVWSKVFVAARHRFDGADVVHLLQATGRTFDWQRLQSHLADYPELLLGFLTLFAFCYPSKRDLVPRWLWDELIARYQTPAVSNVPPECRGTLLDSHSFEFDLLAKGFADAHRKVG
jgi:hypothetical protein